MKIWIGVLSPDVELRRFVGLKKIGIVPPSLQQSSKFGGQPLEIRVSSFVPKLTAPTREEIEAFVHFQTDNAEAAILLFDEAWRHLIEHLRGCCVCLPLEASANPSHAQNSIHKSVARAIKVWWQVQLRFLESKDIKLLSLPLRNFQASELLQLANSVRAAPPEIANDLQIGLKELRKRLRPRRRSTYNTIYMVDDAKRFYVFGHERHSRPETGDGHALSCTLNARFRFGCRIDELRHYNVSESEGENTTISGNFLNCHGVAKDEERETHLNMFASDMYY